MLTARTALQGVLLCLCMASINPATAFDAGFQLERFEDQQRARPILIDWWYPTLGQEVERYNYGLGAGQVVEAGTIAPGEHPLILLSHGAMGAARNYSWIAEALARQGYLVAGISHYGESYVYGPTTVDPSAVLRFWERPLDVSAALSYIAQRSRMAGSVDHQRVGFLGHSSGGATAMSLAGVRFNRENMEAYCQTSQANADKGCDYADGNQAPATADQALASARSYQDQRIFAFVAFDPALGPGFSDYSSVDPTRHMLLVGSMQNDFLPFAHHAGSIAGQYPGANLHSLNRGEGHFVYLNVCTQALEANGVPLCTDGPGVERGLVHAELAALVISHFDRTLRQSD